MISTEYQKFERLVTSEPFEAALKFHDHIGNNIVLREKFLEEYTDRERLYWTQRTFVEASKLADKLIDSCPTGWDCWEKNENECTSAVIETHNLGSYKITRLSKDCRDRYEIYIENEDLSLAISHKDSASDFEDIDLVAEIKDIMDKNFSPEDMADVEWGFELLMTIALDVKGYS